ncbi:LysE/ArgO family amino acid transporter [Arenibaculum pallidiluteum]|uniref:LysE/ArgO family amino acid transporter n=1 Tax=Arenibaculum pallidiluteum TaxID=2812559 RepID=UPI001A9723E7|nr:LysE family transporter [Arenibaculum pallidiluteum]
MDAVSFLAKGLLLGFSIAAPVGPIGLLCIRRTLSGGMVLGFASGLGAAAADAFYGAVAAFGLTAVSQVLMGQQVALRVVGGAVLLWLAIGTFRAKPASEAAPAGNGRGVLAAFLSTAALTVANPATILSFVAVFGALGVGIGSDAGGASAMVAGVFLGSAAWWLLLAGGVALARDRIGPETLRWINRGSGLVLGAFALYALAGVVVGA